MTTFTPERIEELKSHFSEVIANNYMDDLYEQVKEETRRLEEDGEITETEVHFIRNLFNGGSVTVGVDFKQVSS